MAPLLSLLSNSKVLEPLHQMLLPKIRVMRNFPKSVAIDHPTVGGLGLRLLEFEQIVDALNLFLTLCASPTPSLNAMIDSLELMQIVPGLESPVLETNHAKYGCLVTKGWIQSLWESLLSFDIVLHVPFHNYLVSLQTNDIAIMKKAVKLKTFLSKRIANVKLS